MMYPLRKEQGKRALLAFFIDGRHRASHPTAQVVHATAVGILAIGALAIRALAVKSSRIERLNIEELEVDATCEGAGCREGTAARHFLTGT
jgi:hypothetical protein